jgi:hypothetical protein
VTPLPEGLLTLAVLALPIACITWTVTHEDVFKEPREYFVRRSHTARSLAVRKLFYLLTCEYCFSHWVTLPVLLVTGFRLLYDDWRGYFVSGFALVWTANHYMSVFGRLRLGIRSERVEVSLKEELRDQVADTKDKPAPVSQSPLRRSAR